MRRVHLIAVTLLVLTPTAGWLLWLELTAPPQVTETKQDEAGRPATENPYADLFRSITPPATGSRPEPRSARKNTVRPEKPDTQQIAVEAAPSIKQRNNKKQGQSRFLKIAFSGETLDDAAVRWSCARDLTTGLLWETKLANGGVSDASHRYSWYQPDRPNPGRKDGGICNGTACDTDAYVREMNRLGLCGSESWRLPSFTELEGLINRNYYDPTIDQDIFPHAQGKVYWSATELTNNPGMVMQIDFFNGVSTAVPKNLSYRIRVVSH